MSYWTKRRRVHANVQNQIQSLKTPQDEECDSTVEYSPVSVAVQGDHVYTMSMSQKPSYQIFHSHGHKPEDPSSETDPENVFEEHFDSDKYSPSPEDESESDFEVDDSVEEELATWAIYHKIPHVALSSLLKIMRKLQPSLPLDARTLLGTQNVTAVKTLANGSYYHFGISSQAVRFLAMDQALLARDILELQINIDGLPLFKSSSAQFWPILGMLLQSSNNEPFVIGLFCGISKPTSVTEFFHDFVVECRELQETGLHYQNKQYAFRVSSVICDTPARCYVKQTKGHSGYFGCDKCTQPGVFNKKMTYPVTDAPLRTDADFAAMSDEEHHIGHHGFEDLGLGMVSQFPLDYMHLVCLGVTRKLIALWMKGPLTCRLGRRIVNLISDRLLSYQSFFPKEFARKPRSLSEVDRWKATEFRQFLLYGGPVALRGIIPEALYKNFMLLFTGIFLLVSPSHCHDYADYAQQILVLFVQHFGELYGKDMLVYNVHGLTHLAQDVKVFGPLDNISSFPYENFLGKLKKMVRKPSFPLQQVIRRLSEKRYHANVGQEKAKDQTPPFVKMEHFSGPVPQLYQPCRQFKQVSLTGFTVSITQGNNCVKIGDQVCRVRNLLLHDNEIYVVYVRFKTLGDFFTYPMNSGNIDVHLVSDLSDNIRVAHVSTIDQKYVLLPHKDSHVAMPLVHVHE